MTRRMLRWRRRRLAARNPAVYFAGTPARKTAADLWHEGDLWITHGASELGALFHAWAVMDELGYRDARW